MKKLKSNQQKKKLSDISDILSQTRRNKNSPRDSEPSPEEFKNKFQ